ncbi:lipopolysaccharide biosynthesis protein RfbH [Metabacillus fastidiosus]|uniref:lipopolysaccharide biosynthesis protein RfbH n=1 Tax=Metabacillus fastidiosus TaxID=1458 RepID=UPI003D28A397
MKRGDIYEISWKGEIQFIIVVSEVDEEGEVLVNFIDQEANINDLTLKDIKTDKSYPFNSERLERKLGEIELVLLEQVLREQILLQTKNHYQVKHQLTKKNFKIGDRINYAGRVFDENELINLVDSSLDFWLTSGEYTDEFEHKLGKFLNIRYCTVTNSGSSANMLAFMALTSPKLGDKRIFKGDEVITVAASFPTTVAPIIQYGAVPVFVDIDLETYNIKINLLEAAISKKTKAVMIAHTLGNPFNLKAVKDFCDKYNLWLIEDNCDALGSQYLVDGEWKYTGTIGHIGTSSFYPPHHITMGEGGAVYTNNALLNRIVRSLRDWGRDCWCLSGCDNTCMKRFSQKFGELPKGYDHKYIYSHFGYNLKITDMQAAVGCAQLEKIESFKKIRNENWKRLYNGLKRYEQFFYMPCATKFSDPSWFGFLLTIREETPFSREDIVNFLESKRIQTRMLFAGNLIKQPCFDEMRKSQEGYRVVGDLTNTDYVLTNTFWLGVYPGLDNEMIDYIIEQIHNFCLSSTSIIN